MIADLSLTSRAVWCGTTCSGTHAHTHTCTHIQHRSNLGMPGKLLMMNDSCTNISFICGTLHMCHSSRWPVLSRTEQDKEKWKWPTQNTRPHGSVYAEQYPRVYCPRKTGDQTSFVSQWAGHAQLAARSSRVTWILGMMINTLTLLNWPFLPPNFQLVTIFFSIYFY